MTSLGAASASAQGESQQGLVPVVTDDCPKEQLFGICSSPGQVLILGLQAVAGEHCFVPAVCEIWNLELSPAHLLWKYMFLFISIPISWEYAAFPELQDCTSCKSPLIFCLLQLVLSLSHDCAD